MSIPKVIHYCWFGGNELPKDVKKCIKSWEKFCPGYEIKRWDESNFDINENRYAREAYEAKKWAFVSDYARLKIIYDNGGIYLDTDVELIKPLDKLLEYEGFMGHEPHEHSKDYNYQDTISTGLGFGAIKGHPVIKAMLDDYSDISFILPDGTIDNSPCPKRNTAALLKLGLNIDEPYQVIQGIVMLPKECLCPMDYITGKTTITPDTISIHHYGGTWLSPEARRSDRLKRLIGVRWYNFLYAKFLYRSDRWTW